MSPAATWLLILCIVLVGLLTGAIVYALGVRRINRDLEAELANRQGIDEDIELGLRDTRWRRRQLRVVHGDNIGVVTRYGRKLR